MPGGKTKYLLQKIPGYTPCMTAAVVRVLVDRDGRLSADDFAAGVRSLQNLGLTVLSAQGALPERLREVEIIMDAVAAVTDHLVALCESAFGIPAEPGVVTFVSRGTDADAQGVLTRFGTTGVVERGHDGVYEFVTVRLPAGGTRRVPESQLRTALEAALNCEVVIEFA